jgi:hypothetical protein
MSVFPSWPWTNFHEENLDWLIQDVKYIKEHIEEIVVDATTAMLDSTLTLADKAAQAKAAGDAIRANTAQISSVNTSLSNAINEVDTRLSAEIDNYQFPHYEMDLTKTSSDLTYYNQVKVASPLIDLVADIGNNRPFMLLINGAPAYGVNAVVGSQNATIRGRVDVGTSTYTWMITSTATTGTASLVPADGVRVVFQQSGSTAAYFLGNYQTLTDILNSFRNYSNIIYRVSVQQAVYVMDSWHYSGGLDTVVLTFNNGAITLTCSSDGTITRS